MRRVKLFSANQRLTILKKELNSSKVLMETISDKKCSTENLNIKIQRFVVVDTDLTDTIIVSHVRKSKLGIQMFIEAKVQMK